MEVYRYPSCYEFALSDSGISEDWEVVKRPFLLGAV
jgi:hypothetical protein